MTDQWAIDAEQARSIAANPPRPAPIDLAADTEGQMRRKHRSDLDNLYNALGQYQQEAPRLQGALRMAEAEVVRVQHAIERNLENQRRFEREIVAMETEQ